MDAIVLAISFCTGAYDGSWFDLYNHASATALSPMLRWHGNGNVSSSNARWCEISAAINSLVLRVSATCSSGENLCLHILPVIGSYPPIPVSHASLIDIEVGSWNTMELRDIPSFAYLMNWSHSLRSFFVSVEMRVLQCFLAYSSSRLIRLIKCLACGMMNATWLILPTRVARVW